MTKYSEYKSDLLNHVRLLSEHGYLSAMMGTGGNVSVRIKGENAFAITPSGMPYKNLTSDDICILDFEKNQIEGTHAPSMESGMHVAIYKRRPDVNAVVHTHQNKGSLFSVINLPIPALFDEVCINIGEIVDVVPYAFSGSQELAENVAGKLDNNCHCYILQNHGVLCLGHTIERACLNVELLERVATVYADALFTGREISTLPEETVNRVKLTRKGSQKDRG
ncbi:MAG: class II aldolase/adducin family protein [Deltaproteobacteria bacterium]|nr:class II aldolase/adducin family protein [Deltaproteobacteria bacterium]